MEILRVGAKTNPNKLAGAIAGEVEERGLAEMSAIGASAINQTIKGIIVAREFCAAKGIDLISVCEFKDVPIDGKIKTAIRFIVEPR